ncbi:MAG: hypothetical protein M1820_008896 [Bogoriella megaspora]|nr:MAG: hypothetical protein M1820_008896 [Bogoriella megaspora]
MASPPSVFLLGAGYIGQNVLDELPTTNHPVTTLVRRPEQATVLEQAGSKTVLGTLSDLDLITTTTAQHDVTINTASCDDLPSVEAILAGIRQRTAAGKQSIYIHTSGTGVLEDGALGMYKTDKIYRDDVPADIEGLSPTSMHRHVDIPLVQAAREFGDKAKIVILLPPLVYGVNPKHNRHTFALLHLVRFGLTHGFAGYVGEGTNVWSVVHVQDLGRAYIPLLAWIEKAAPAEVLANPYFFAESGEEVSMKEAAEHIGGALYDMGKLKSLKVQAFKEEDYQHVFGDFTAKALGCNSRSRAIRLRELGWKIKEKDAKTTWREDEIPSIVKALESA